VLRSSADLGVRRVARARDVVGVIASAPFDHGGVTEGFAGGDRGRDLGRAVEGRCGGDSPTQGSAPLGRACAAPQFTRIGAEYAIRLCTTLHLTTLLLHEIIKRDFGQILVGQLLQRRGVKSRYKSAPDS